MTLTHTHYMLTCSSDYNPTHVSRPPLPPHLLPLHMAPVHLLDEGSQVLHAAASAVLQIEHCLWTLEKDLGATHAVLTRVHSAGLIGEGLGISQG